MISCSEAEYEPESVRNHIALHPDLLCSLPSLTLPSWLTDKSLQNALWSGALVKIPEAFPEEWARAMLLEFEQIPRKHWLHSYDSVPSGMQLVQHNIYEEPENFKNAAPCYAYFVQWLQEKFVASIIAEHLSPDATIQVAPSLHMAGDYQTAHTDEGHNRRLAFVWHLVDDWKPYWGGDLVWCDPFSRHCPLFNCLYLFRVHSSSYHFVQNVWKDAPSRRYAIAGWITSSTKDETPIIKKGTFLWESQDFSK